ncbi:MAG: DUF4358 domain-containing protein [Hydrogenoanaerobacterium sp.]
MKKLLSIFLLTLLLLFSSCSNNRLSVPDPIEDNSIAYATTEPEHLSDIIDLIYKDITITGQTNAIYSDLSDIFHLDSTMVEDYAARYTNGRYGVADVVILKLKNPDDTAQKEAVISGLEQRRDDRIAEFENYDVHDAFNIAKNAEVFTRGSYVILLMLADAEDAHTIILENIPG